MTTHEFDSASFATHDSTELTLDVFAPRSTARHCAVLVLHGGGWRAGARDLVHDRAAELAARGFTALTVQYRLLDAAPWPAALDDAAAAIAWVRDNASRLDVDPAAIVVQGHSAGGHIALMTGTLPARQRPDAIVAYYPATGFYAAGPMPPPPDRTAPPAAPLIPLDELGRLPGWMLFGPDADQALLDSASPITLVEPGFPPTILFHGTADVALDIRSSIGLHSRLVKLGVSSDLHIYAGGNHEFDMAPSMTATCVDTATCFIERTVTHRAERELEAAKYPFPPAVPDAH